MIKIFLLGMPLIVASAGCLIIYQAWRDTSSRNGRTQNLHLLLFLLTLAGTWLGWFLCHLAPDVFNVCFPFYSVVALLMPVFLWAYIRLVLVEERKQASILPVWKHYILPVVLSITVNILSNLPDGFRKTIPPAMLLLNILHLVLALVYGSLSISILIRRYRKNRMPDVFPFPSGWLPTVSAIIGVQLLTIVLSVFTGEPESCAGLPYMVTGALLISILTGRLAYRVICTEALLSGQVITGEDMEGEEKSAAVQPPPKRSRQKKNESRDEDEGVDLSPSAAPDLSRRQFESYVFSVKPWLNPKLSITGLAERMKTNRTYLSAFVNKEYGMNFNRWANDCRLKELEHLKSLPENENASLRSLVAKAGFGTYQGYYLARNNTEEKEEADE
ncbi:MAG: hypothetical protein LBL58_16710 [Tannerellaceae bacterium]|jgi:AraC-like DNA-binding protein|nr:hypothetical protein [Tannerellaceae bacterium]